MQSLPSVQGFWSLQPPGFAPWHVVAEPPSSATDPSLATDPSVATDPLVPPSPPWSEVLSCSPTGWSEELQAPATNAKRPIANAIDEEERSIKVRMCVEWPASP